jgi:hypothetical protein
MKKPFGRFAYLTLLLLAVSYTAYAERQERLIDGWRPVHFDVSLALNDSLSELTSVKTDVIVTILKKDVVMIDRRFRKNARQAGSRRWQRCPLRSAR